MPNWCYNHLEITGEKSAVADFKTATTNEDGHLSFECLVPMPESLRKPDGGDGWYAWSVEHWGTKWDIDGREVGTEHTVTDAGTSRLVYDFNTAWAPPTAWLERVAAKYPNLKFALWFDEPGADFSGLETFENGVINHQASWSHESVGSALCAVRDCDEYAEGRPVTDFTRAPKPEELEAFCEEHELVKAVVTAMRVSGEPVTLLRAQ